MPERLPRGKPALSIDQMEQIAKLSEKYLQCETAEFSEGELLSNLRALYEISLQQNSKMSKKHSKRIEKLAITAFSAFGPNRHPSHISDTAGSDSPQKHHSSSLKDNTGTETILKDNRSPGLFGRVLYLQKARYYRRLADKYHAKSTTTKDDNKRVSYNQKVVENSVKAAEFYAIVGDFKDEIAMYSTAISSSTNQLQKASYHEKQAECYEKIGDFGNATAHYTEAATHTLDAMQKSRCYGKAGELSEKEGHYENAGAMFEEAGNSASEKSQKDLYYEKSNVNHVKSLELANEISREALETVDETKKNQLIIQAEEIYSKSGNFREAGTMYLLLANDNFNQVKKQVLLLKAGEYFSKAEENYEKSRNFREAGDMYVEVAKIHYKYGNSNEVCAMYSKAAENYEKAGNFKEAGDEYSKVGSYTVDPAQRSAFYLKAAENYEKSGNFKEAGTAYCSASHEVGGHSFYLKAGKNYEKSGNFDWAGYQYLYEANSISAQAKKQALHLKAGGCFSKAEENFVKSGNFIEAGDMYRYARGCTSDPVQKQVFFTKAGECYSKAEENYVKSGNFEAAGGMFRTAGDKTFDWEQRRAFYLKAEENFGKSGNFRDAEDMYRAAADISRFNLAQRKAFYSKAEENYRKTGNIREVCSMYRYAADNANEPAQKKVFYSKAAENYKKSGDFKEAGNMYIEAVKYANRLAQKDVFYSKGAECFSKAAENYEKSGSFREAGDTYHYAGEKTFGSEQKQRDYFYSKAGECYSKAAEIHEKSGEFGEAGNMYRNAADNISDPVQKQAFFSKAAESFLKAAEIHEKSGEFGKAGNMYRKAYNNTTNPAKRQAYDSKSNVCVGIANALDANPTDKTFLISLSSRFNDPHMFSSKADKSAFTKCIEEYAAQSDSKISDADDFSAKVFEKEARKSLEKSGGQVTIDNFSIKNEKGELKVYYNLAISEVLASLPMRYLPIFIDEVLEKKDAISKLKESQLPEAFNRIVRRIKIESKEFERKLSSGEKIDAKYVKYLYNVISNIESSHFSNSISNVVGKLGIAPRAITPAFFEELYSNANEKIKPLFIIPTEVYSLDFLARQVDASVPADAIKSAATAIKDSGEAYERQKNEAAEPKGGLKERCGEVLKISEIQDEAQRKEKTLELLPEDKRKMYLDGQMTDENAIRLILKNKDVGDLSWVFWDIASKLPEAEQMMLKKVSQNEPLDQAETNRLVQIVGKFDVYLGEYLLDNKLSVLEPSIKATPAFREFANIKKKVTEVATKQASENMDLKIVFGQENRLLDIFAGSFSGNCLGDNPASSLARKDVAIATLYKDGQPAGAAFFLLREINGKKSLVLFGVDFSEALTGSKDAETTLSTEKVNELARWVAQCVQDYAISSGFGLYATTQGGGISNNVTVASELLRHFGEVKVQFENSGNLHPSYGYNVSDAFSFEFKK